MAPRGSISSLVLASLVAAAVALGFWWPVTGVGLLSDDWLLPQLLIPNAGVRDIDWDFVLRDFVGPWFGTEGAALYRPLVSVSLAFDIARGGLEDPRVFHATNLACHVLSTALVAVLCHRLAARRFAICALLGGLVFALHPIASESTAWIVARNSGLTVTFVLLATCAWAFHLQTKGRVAWTIAVFASVLALMTKESALVLPLLFVAVDVFGQGLSTVARSSFGAFVKRHALLLPLWLAYLAWRIYLFGSITGEGIGAEPTLAAWLNGIGVRLAKLCAIDGGVHVLASIGAMSLIAVALFERLRLDPRATLLAILSLAFALLAGFAIGADVSLERGERTGARILLVFVPCLALLAPVLMGAHESRRAFLAFALLPWIVANGIASRTDLANYAQAGTEMTRCVDALRAAADGRELANASAVLATPSSVAGVPFLNPNAVFAVATRPLHDAATPLIGLNCILLRLPDQPELYHDARPARAVLENGGELLAWVSGQLVRFGAPPRLTETPALSDTSHVWRLEQLASPFAFEGLAIDLPTGEHAWTDKARLRVLGHDGAPTEDAFAPRIVGRTLHFDVSASIHVASLAFSGGVRGFELQGCPAHVRPSLRVVSRVDEFAVDSSFAGKEAQIEDGVVRIDGVALRNPAGDGLRAVLLAAGLGYAFDVEGQSELVLPESVVDGLDNFLRSDTARALWIYWERRGTAQRPPARSRLIPFRYDMQSTR